MLICEDVQHTQSRHISREDALENKCLLVKPTRLFPQLKIKGTHFVNKVAGLKADNYISTWKEPQNAWGKNTPKYKFQNENLPLRPKRPALPILCK